MVHATASQGFAADIEAVNQDHIVVLHRWNDGMLLVLTFDDDMPAFTAKLIEPGISLDDIPSMDTRTTATGYVFRVAEPNTKGTFDFEDVRYAFIDIEDYVVWSDDDAVRKKYEEVVGKARAE